jgi:hypothetical protein
MPVLMWCIGWQIALRRHPLWYGFRFPWALGSLLLLVHIAIAFHLGHGWSHSAAWEHTRAVGGYGAGIFVNYAVAVVWLADAVWVWVAPGSYRTRTWWLHGSIHGFIAFVVFNAAFVFADWSTRIWFVMSFVMMWLILRYIRAIH